MGYIQVRLQMEENLAASSTKYWYPFVPPLSWLLCDCMDQELVVGYPQEPPHLQHMKCGVFNTRLQTILVLVHAFLQKWDTLTPK